MNSKTYDNKIFENFPDCVNVKELQSMLRIKRTKAYRLLRSGEIKSIKIGKDYKISKQNIISFLYGGEQI